MSLLLLSRPCRADPYDTIDKQQYQVYTSKDAINITASAMTKRDDVSLLLKNSETWFWKTATQVGVNQNNVVPVLFLTYPLYFHKVSTRPLYMHWEPIKHVAIRPDLDYYVDSSYGLYLSLDWKF